MLNLVPADGMLDLVHNDLGASVPCAPGLPPDGYTMLAALALHDRPTYRHSVRVGALAWRIAALMSIDEEHRWQIWRAGLFHDCGKLLTPSSILRNPGPLSDNEVRMLRQHPVDGAQLLRVFKGLADIEVFVLTHHERPDGFGYPTGTRAVPLGASIVALASALDGMAAQGRQRRLGRANSGAAVRAMLRNEAGRSWDAGLALKLAAFWPSVQRTAGYALGGEAANPNEQVFDGHSQPMAFT